MTDPTPGPDIVPLPLPEIDDPFGDDTRFGLFEHELAILYPSEDVISQSDGDLAISETKKPFL